MVTKNTSYHPLMGDVEPATYYRRGSFQDGGFVQIPDDIIKHSDGNWYRYKNAIPAGGVPVLPGTSPDSNWELVGLRGDVIDRLGTTSGFRFIGQAASIAEVRAIEPTKPNERILMKQYGPIKGVGGGEFWYDELDTTTADNGGTILVTAGGKRWKKIMKGTGYSAEDFGADPNGVVDSRAAIQAAIDFVGTLKNKILYLTGTYRIEGDTTITMANGVQLLGTRRGMTQGPQTILGDTMRVVNDTTFHVAMTPGKTTPLFTAGRDAVFSGFSVVYINQPKEAATINDILTYGPTIWASHSCSVVNVRYVAAWDFFNGRGEAHFLSDIYGYAFNVDFHIEMCADVTRLKNIHINSNVYRPGWSILDVAAPRVTSRAFEMVQHDGIMFEGIHVFAKGTVWHNRQNSTSRLCSLNGTDFLFDKCGTMLDSDVNGGVCCSLSNGVFIHDYHTNEGAALNLTNPVGTQVTSYYLTDWKWQLGSAGTSPGQGSWAANWMNFNGAAGTRVWLDNINILAMGTLALNNNAQFNRIEGSVTIGTRKINFRPQNANLVENHRLVSMDPFTNIPYGFTKLGTAVTVSGRNVTSTAATSPTGLGISTRVAQTFPSSCAVWVYASQKGDSSGILVTAYQAGFTNPITWSAQWEAMGNSWLARLEVPSSAGRTHWDITANAPSATGGTLTIQSVHMIAGTTLEFSPESDSVSIHTNQVGALRGKMTLVANVPQELPPAHFGGDRGVISLYVKSATVVGYWVLSKRLIGDTGTVTQIAYAAGAETITVDWPAGSGAKPRVMSSAGGDVDVTIAGV